MGTAALVSIEEYLHTTYPDGDREYVDGAIVERNVGELGHADIQGLLVMELSKRYPFLWVRPEARVQVSASRFRVPDVLIVNGPRPQGRFLSEPPLAVAEILSPDDRAGDLEEKIADYLAFGIRYIWVINPHTRRGYIHTPEGAFEAKDGYLWTRDPEIRLPLTELFY
jgi:Uma2 family endonuclease